MVDRDVVTVGKLSDCDLVLSDPSVSRHHLSISRTSAHEWLLRDLGSTNGSFVNDARVHEATVEAGTILKAGRVEIAFVPEIQRFEVPPWPEEHFGPLLGRSKAMRQLFGMIARIAETDATVLIEGETGTGKGLVARAIHQASLRDRAPFIVVDCGAVQRQLVESELFGHEKGAFSGAYARREGAFERASGGTVFIDELGELELELQPKLLRVLDAREVRRLGAPEPTAVDIRVVAASRADLQREVERGVFREDLFFRLSVVTLRLPPLRERAEDIAPLAEHFLREIAASRGVKPPRLEASIIDRLTSHDWRGNVRELKNVVERAVLLHQVRAGDRLEIGDLSSRGRRAGMGSTSGTTGSGAGVARDATIADAEPLHTEGGGAAAAFDYDASFDPSLSFSESKERWMDAREKKYVDWLLASNEGNVSQAARSAKMDRKYLHKLIKKHGLDVRGHEG